MNMTDDQKRKIMIFDLPIENWNIIENGMIELFVKEENYIDRWRISPDGSMVLQEREYQDNLNVWVLMCPDCGCAYDNGRH